MTYQRPEKDAVRDGRHLMQQDAEPRPNVLFIDSEHPRVVAAVAVLTTAIHAGGCARRRLNLSEKSNATRR